VTAGTTASINSQSCVSIEVSNNDMLTVGGNLTNNGTVRLSAQAGLAVDVYTPITVGGSWLGGTGSYEAFGGVWNATGHTLRLWGPRRSRMVRKPLSTCSISTGSRSATECMPTSNQLKAVTVLGSKRPPPSGQTLTDLKNLMGQGKRVQGSWDFDILNLPEGDSVLLSFQLLEDVDVADLTVWHHDDQGGWTRYDAGDLTVTDGWANFTVNSFSSYAVTVPEPATMSLLALGAVALLRRRKK
jgi:hypothetical protein